MGQACCRWCLRTGPQGQVPSKSSTRSRQLGVWGHSQWRAQLGRGHVSARQGCSGLELGHSAVLLWQGLVALGSYFKENGKGPRTVKLEP